MPADLALQPPTGDAWLHEIKHDGFRVVARKDGERVRLYSRPGNDLTDRFPLIVETLANLAADQDGEPGRSGCEAGGRGGVAVKP
jgi:ATP-dependent DNA ligase